MNGLWKTDERKKGVQPFPPKSSNICAQENHFRVLHMKILDVPSPLSAVTLKRG